MVSIFLFSLIVLSSSEYCLTKRGLSSLSGAQWHVPYVRNSDEDSVNRTPLEHRDTKRRRFSARTHCHSNSITRYSAEGEKSYAKPSKSSDTMDHMQTEDSSNIDRSLSQLNSAIKRDVEKVHPITTQSALFEFSNIERDTVPSLGNLPSVSPTPILPTKSFPPVLSRNISHKGNTVAMESSRPKMRSKKLRTVSTPRMVHAWKETETSGPHGTQPNGTVHQLPMTVKKPSHPVDNTLHSMVRLTEARDTHVHSDKPAGMKVQDVVLHVQRFLEKIELQWEESMEFATAPEVVKPETLYQDSLYDDIAPCVFANLMKRTSFFALTTRLSHLLSLYITNPWVEVLKIYLFAPHEDKTEDFSQAGTELDSEVGIDMMIGGITKTVAQYMDLLQRRPPFIVELIRVRPSVHLEESGIDESSNKKHFLHQWKERLCAALADPKNVELKTNAHVRNFVQQKVRVSQIEDDVLLSELLVYESKKSSTDSKHGLIDTSPQNVPMEKHEDEIPSPIGEEEVDAPLSMSDIVSSMNETPQVGFTTLPDFGIHRREMSCGIEIDNIFGTADRSTKNLAMEIALQKTVDVALLRMVRQAHQYAQHHEEARLCTVTFRVQKLLTYKLGHRMHEIDLQADSAYFSAIAQLPRMLAVAFLRLQGIEMVNSLSPNIQFHLVLPDLPEDKRCILESSLEHVRKELSNPLSLSSPIFGRLFASPALTHSQSTTSFLTKERQGASWSPPLRAKSELLYTPGLDIMNLGDSLTRKEDSEQGFRVSRGRPQRKLLVLDLDHTILHTTRKMEARSSIVLRTSESEWFYLHFRPHLRSFLEYMVSQFHVAVFTAGTTQYADKVIKLVQQHVYPEFSPLRIFSREHCTKFSGPGLHASYVKDLLHKLRDIHFGDLSSVFIIDDTPASYVLNVRNAYPVPSWKFDYKNDSVLKETVSWLQRLEKADTVYCVLQEYQHYMMLRAASPTREANTQDTSLILPEKHEPREEI